jgi:hypothetical protein
VVFLFSLLEKHILVVDIASKEITRTINGLYKLHAVSLVASSVFHICVRSGTDWACCQQKQVRTGQTVLTATCATVTKPVSKLFIGL